MAGASSVDVRGVMEFVIPRLQKIEGSLGPEPFLTSQGLDVAQERGSADLGAQGGRAEGLAQPARSGMPDHRAL